MNKVNFLIFGIIIILIGFTISVNAEAERPMLTGEIVDGIVGNAMDGYLQFPDIEELDVTGNQLTLEVWVKPREAGGHQPFITKGDSQFALKTSGSNIEFFIYDIEKENQRWDGDYWVVLEYPIPDDWYDNWQHLAGVYDGSSMKLYLNCSYITSIRVHSMQGIGWNRPLVTAPKTSPSFRNKYYISIR